MASATSPALDPSFKDPSIKTIMVEANAISFEVDTCGEGDKLALCLHGFPEHSFAWRHQLPLLAKLGYRAWAPCLRGYGNSSMPKGVKSYKVDTLMQDVAGLIDASGAKETVLISHDWGGAIAWIFATQRIRPLKKLIFMNIPHPSAMIKFGKFKQIRKSYYILLFQLPRIPERLLGKGNGQAVADLFKKTTRRREMFPDEVVDVFAKNAARPGGLTAMLNYYRGVLRYPYTKNPDRPKPSKIAVPTLLIWGDADFALTTEAAEGSAHYCEDFRIKYIKGGSHWIQQERPEEVNALVTDFLS